MAAPNENRRRNLGILGGATLLITILAGVALNQRARDTGPSFDPQPLVPGLADVVNNIGEVTVETREDVFHARRTEEGDWIVVERNNFPANIAMVRSAAVGMSELQAVESRTAQPELFGRLGLIAPEDDGEAIRVILRDREGETIGDILIGSNQGIVDPEGLNRFYARRTGENQTWLARGSMTVQPEISEWLDKNVIDIERDNIRSTRFTPLEGPSFTLTRETEEDSDYAIDAIPAGRELSYPGVTFGPATAISNFTFADVRLVSEIDFSDATEIVSETFDGVQIIVRIAQEGDTSWASLAALASGEVEQQQQADYVNLAGHGWAFELPEFAAQSFLTTRDSLLAPLAE
jgi:hypothetical protein